MATPSGEAVQMPASTTSKWGLGREAQAAVLFKNQPECPECNQSELTWAIPRLWDSYHAKSSNIRHRQDRAQNKGWNRNKLGADHPPLVTGSQSHKGWKGAIVAQERHYLPKCKQASLLTDFWGFWTVISRQRRDASVTPKN